MLKKLLALSVVVLVVALLAAPAYAQVANPMLEPGTDEYLINLFGLEGDITPFCENVEPGSQAGWMEVFPNLGNLCGWQ
jgi:hypothetical protein